MLSLYALNFDDVRKLVASFAEKPFRAKQIWQFLYGGHVQSLSDMHNIPQTLRNKIAQAGYSVFDMSVIKRQTSSDGKTKKYLIELNDKHTIEAVLMHYRHGNTLCVSSQVGCRMGCTFCASTLDGLARQLCAYEMIEQVALISQIETLNITHVVLMGSGEPLDNFDEVIAFIKAINQPERFNIGQRHITLSTCGLVDNIKRLAEQNLQITLAVSLHSPFDEVRDIIVPVNRQYGLRALLEAIDHYIAKTKRRVSIEYTLIKGQNDDRAHAAQLCKLFSGKLIHINLIALNSIAERDYQASEKAHIIQFQQALLRCGLNVTLRRGLGDDIDGACGQLRRGTRAR